LERVNLNQKYRGIPKEPAKRGQKLKLFTTALTRYFPSLPLPAPGLALWISG
jgi:hypothetical protein